MNKVRFVEVEPERISGSDYRRFDVFLNNVKHGFFIYSYSRHYVRTWTGAWGNRKPEYDVYRTVNAYLGDKEASLDHLSDLNEVKRFIRYGLGNPNGPAFVEMPHDLFHYREMAFYENKRVHFTTSTLQWFKDNKIREPIVHQFDPKLIMLFASDEEAALFKLKWKYD